MSDKYHKNNLFPWGNEFELMNLLPFGREYRVQNTNSPQLNNRITWKRGGYKNNNKKKLKIKNFQRKRAMEKNWKLKKLKNKVMDTLMFIILSDRLCSLVFVIFKIFNNCTFLSEVFNFQLFLIIFFYMWEHIFSHAGLPCSMNFDYPCSLAHER